MGVRGEKRGERIIAGELGEWQRGGGMAGGWKDGDTIVLKCVERNTASWRQ